MQFQLLQICKVLEFFYQKKILNNIVFWGSGCGSVGRAVAFDTRGLRVESSHRRIFKEQLFTVYCIEKTKINKKRPRMAHWKTISRIFTQKVCNSFKIIVYKKWVVRFAVDRDLNGVTTAMTKKIGTTFNGKLELWPVHINKIVETFLL